MRENFSQKKTLNEYEASKYLGLSVITLRNWRCYRKGPKYMKLGRAVRYRIEDLDEYMNQQTITPFMRSNREGNKIPYNLYEKIREVAYHQKISQAEVIRLSLIHI